MCALSRIGNPSAFQKWLPTCKSKSNYDNHSKGSFEYKIITAASPQEPKIVTYQYTTQRWAPTPRGGNVVLNKFGYSEVAFIAVDEKRIVPINNEFSAKRITTTPASTFVTEGMSAIFGTNKFSMLRRYASSKGNAYIIKHGTDFITERNFSSGEINILRLLTKIDNMNNKSLLVIDEIEMSLHPSAQNNLFDYLSQYSRKKDAIVIFSTHSETIIRAASPAQIILLLNDNGAVSITCPCYSEVALESISNFKKTNPDVIILVEDLRAEKLARALFNRYKEIS